MSHFKKTFLVTLQIIFIPISIIFGFAIEIRNILYDWRIFKSYSYPIPIISVGNISVGGSGKTPFTIFLAQKLQNRFPNIAVISRGYGRKSKGLQLVSDGRQILLRPNLAGDEPYLIARRLSEVVVAVSARRKEAIDYVLKNFSIDLIILDDAFQHRSIKRDVDIVLVNAKEKAAFDLPLPSGRLREFKQNLRRAHLIVATNVASGESLKLGTPANFFVCSQLTELIDVEFKSSGNIASLAGQKAIAFAGIAHPQNFCDALKKEGIDVVFFQKFADHHDYSVQDLERMLSKAKTIHCQVLLCTEKDLVKISGLIQEDAQRLRLRPDVRLYAVALQLAVDDEKKLLQKIERCVDKKG